MKYKICIRFLGDISLFTPEIKTLIARVLDVCKDNNRLVYFFYNISFCFKNLKKLLIIKNTLFLAW